jgi:3-carboxy-cis,cis-muconate cycloisomerase
MPSTSSLSSTPEMQAVFAPRAGVQRMLDVEAALARAEAQCGVIPAAASAAIARCCDANRIDLPALGAAAASAGNLAIPLVKQLTKNVTEADAEAAKYVHWGATSQDIIDTGLVLQLRDAFRLIEADLDRLVDALAALAQRHRDTAMVGRTWLQHALPISFGLKVAGWLDALLRHHERLTAARTRALTLQFGGAAGTLASLNDRGLQVAEALARELDLRLPDLPWHTARDNFAEAATMLGLLTGTLGKIARDISLQMQTEVAELAEPAGAGRGGSSTMPHKRNPVGCAIALAAAVRMPGLVSTMLNGMVQEHERAPGGWQAEWETLPEIAQLAAASLRQMREVTEGLSVDEQRMRVNLDLTHGLIMAEAVTLALGAKLGRMQAHELVERACRAAVDGNRSLIEVLQADPQVSAQLSTPELERLLDPATHTGQAGAFVDRVLQAWRRARGAQPESA